ncbi:MAG: bifunctional folylpolyglutamate synthase/dihydrofolate synthase, partial [Gammaproteobacteria bacterium]|nr:bifunctional folylpolyglutamate synthase/dihydrofolate synthase [Gammaproteobacteria bacterium]
MVIRDRPIPALLGDIQIQNAAGAITAIEYLQDSLPVSQSDIRHGLLGVKLTGRMQRIGTAEPEQIVDVAHNPHAARQLAENMAKHPARGKTHAVVAMLADKDMSGVFSELCAHVDHWYLAPLGVARGASAVELASACSSACNEIPIDICESVTAAAELARQSAEQYDRIIIFGSFYTVAEILKQTV